MAGTPTQQLAPTQHAQQLETRGGKGAGQAASTLDNAGEAVEGGGCMEYPAPELVGQAGTSLLSLQPLDSHLRSHTGMYVVCPVAASTVTLRSSSTPVCMPFNMPAGTAHARTIDAGFDVGRPNEAPTKP
jgi:hypothetical protein